MADTKTEKETIEVSKNQEIDQEEEIVCTVAKKQSTSDLITYSAQLFLLISSFIWLISATLSGIFEVDSHNINMLVGLTCSILATYYKVRMSINPNFKPPCNSCFPKGKEIPQTRPGEKMYLDVLNVLDHKYGSMFFGIPNSVFGIFYYMFMMYIHRYNVIFPFCSYCCDSMLIYKTLTFLSVMGGMYLWYLMVYKIRTVCSLCMTVHSANFLTLVYLFFV